MMALALLSFQAVCSSAAGVYNQWLLKGNEGARCMELWEKNIFMYIWGLTFGFGERGRALPGLALSAVLPVRRLRSLQRDLMRGSCVPVCPAVFLLLMRPEQLGWKFFDMFDSVYIILITSSSAFMGKGGAVGSCGGPCGGSCLLPRGCPLSDRL